MHSEPLGVRIELRRDLFNPPHAGPQATIERTDRNSKSGSPSRNRSKIQRTLDHRQYCEILNVVLDPLILKVSCMDSAATGDPKLKIYVSYAHPDTGFANELVEGLEYDGRFSVSIDHQALDQGDDWKIRRGTLIAEADTIVCVLSPDAVRSSIFAAEAAYAHELCKHIQPVLHRPLGHATVPTPLAKINAIRFDQDRSFMEGLKTLANLLRQNADWLRTHTQLYFRAREWQDAGQPVSHLLSGADIEAAENWAMNRPDEAPSLTDLHMAFISASENMGDAAHNGPGSLNDPQGAIHQGQSLHRVNRFYLAIAILLAIAAALATWLAFEAREQAEAAKREAMVQKQEAEEAKVEAVIQRKRIEDALKTVHASLCVEVKQVTKTLATTNDDAIWDNKFGLFWTLYDGPMIALEQLENALSDDASNLVVAAMIEFGKELGRRGEPYEARASGLPRRKLMEQAGAISQMCTKIPIKR